MSNPDDLGALEEQLETRVPADPCIKNLSLGLSRLTHSHSSEKSG